MQTKSGPERRENIRLAPSARSTRPTFIEQSLLKNKTSRRGVGFLYIRLYI